MTNMTILKSPEYMTILKSREYMTILKSPEYSCLRICNVDNAKVIVIDRICTCSKLIFQPESNKHCAKTRNQKHVAQRQEIKTNKVFQRRNHKSKRKKTENM